jgi:hypothetical protein
MNNERAKAQMHNQTAHEKATLLNSPPQTHEGSLRMTRPSSNAMIASSVAASATFVKTSLYVTPPDHQNVSINQQQAAAP